MESLMATYRDEEEEEEKENPNKPVNTLLNQSTSTPQEPTTTTTTTTTTDGPSSSFSPSSGEEQFSEPQTNPHQPKKHRPLSSLTPPQQPPIPKKPIKKKPNSVWFSKSNRKGKKKTKPKPKPKTNGSNQHPSSLPQPPFHVIPLPRVPDKTDDAQGMKICLSKVHKAEKVELSEDRLSAGSGKGYRMVRATRGVVRGAWYYEIKAERLGETGHVRLGWSTEKGDLQAPVGYDGNSFGYRDIDGCKIHKAMREEYGDGRGFVEGDVIGFYINLPDGDLYLPKKTNWVWYKGHKYASPANGKEDSHKVVPGSEISFFKNGVCQGVAFKDINGGCYYPAASMYTLPNQPNCVVKFNFGPDFDFHPENFGDRPLPMPMIEVPYEVSDGVAENGAHSEENFNRALKSLTE